MADIQYLNYGDQQIEQQALLNNLANQVQDYVSKQSWSNKRKEKFMSAYSDLMNRGIQGASNSTGQWVINVGGDSPVPLDTMSRKDREMYQEAAYFIQQQMASLPTKASQEEKEEIDKSKLPIFDHSTFKKGFLNQVSNDYFGGSDEIKTSSWDEYDKRDDKGIRGRAKRAEMLVGSLERYAQNLEQNKDKYNFEGSPFGSLDEFKNRIAAARKALIETPDDTDDDFKALNALGLDASEWFNNGSGDPSGQYIKLADGTQRQLSYAELNEYNQEQAKIKEEENAKLLKKKRQEAYNNTLFLNRVTNPKMQGQNPLALKEKYKDSNSLLAALQGYAQKDIRTLTPDEQSEVHGAYKNLANEPIDNDLLNKIKNSSSGLYKNAAPNRFRKIKGIDNLIWDSIAKQVIQINTRQQQQAVQNQPQDLFAGVQTQEEQKNNPRQLSEGLKYEDYARIGAALGDVISLGGFWANVGGSIVSLIGDTTADIADDKVSTWEAVQNLGKNLGWTAAGFIPGGKLGKVAEHMLRWGPKLLVALNDYNLLNDESNKKTWNKLTSDKLVKEGLNDEDLKNITYWVRALTGTANAAKATARDIKYSKARGTAGQEFTTKDGTKIILSNKDVQEINVAGARKGQKAAEAKFKEKAKKVTGTEHEAAEGTFKFSENGRNGLFKNTRSKLQDQQLQGESKVFRTPEQQRYYDLLLQDRRIGGYGGWRWLGSRGTSSYFNHFDKGLSFRNPLRGITQKLDPYKNIESLQQRNSNHPNSNSNEVSHNNSNNSNNNGVPHSKNEIRKEWKNTIEKHNFTNNELSKNTTESYSINNSVNPELGLHMTVHTNEDGSGYLNITRNINNTTIPISFRNQKDLQLRVSELLKDMRKTTNNSTAKAGLNHKEIGKILQDLKRKGWLREGGKIDKQRIQKYKEFINK